jgi:hypothetical protein
MKYGAIIAAVIAVLLIAAIAYFALQPPAAPMPTASPSPPTTPTPTQTPTATPQMRYTVIIATGGVGGVYYYYGGVIAGILKNFTNIDASSIQTAASIDNLLLIRDKTDPGRGLYYCGTVLPDSAYLAYTGQHDKFKDKPAPTAILWAMYPNYLHIVTRSDSGVKTIYDLRGKRVSTGAPGSGTEVEALLLLQVLGIDPAKDFAKWERLGAAESANALRDGAIDAYFWSGGLPTSSVVELAAALKQRGVSLVLIEVPDEVATQFFAKFPGLASKSVVPKTIYGTDKDVQTLVFWNMFVCHKDMPEDLAYQITKTVFDRLDILQKSIAAAKDTNLQNALLYYGGTIPYHPGALRYYREKGVLK